MTECTRRIERMLISVSNKDGAAAMAAFAQSKYKLDILSSGGTAKALTEGGLTVTEVSTYTGFPEGLDGRVKTLHPKVHGGILYERENPAHQEWIATHGILPIDLVVVNLYPFHDAVSKPGVTRSTVIENIDVGGPSMLRAAAKNHAYVTVISDPADYQALLENMHQNRGNTSPDFRWRMACKAFVHCAMYDMDIAATLPLYPPTAL
jgi:phosphoribosylaminoimidazolecarboxamide formyltransferase/IMP cyclohydrolase